MHESVVQIVDDLVREGCSLGASDIHLDADREVVLVRLRVHGMLHEHKRLPKRFHPELIARLKILAQLRTDEHHTTQDGRFEHTLLGNKRVDVRVAIAPSYHGETAVLRLLHHDKHTISLLELGFNRTHGEIIERALAKSSGMILVTGPTGSGKTSTLYSMLTLLNKPEASLVSIEDPIEYAINGVKQIPVNVRTGLTFAQGLRSILRHDPNIIMVGEIRDAETAHIAVNSALTGHLLLSTLHTNDSATSIPRLLDLGLEPYLIASTLRLVVGQRLVRTLCAYCKKQTNLTSALTERLRQYTQTVHLRESDPIFCAQGCDRCNGTGYAGRTVIAETLLVDNVIRDAITTKSSAEVIKRLATTQGTQAMSNDGMAKVRAGVTTLEEVLRVITD